MADYSYTDLTLSVRERPNADQVEIGVDIDGAFFALGSFKLQGFNIEKAEAQQAAAEAKAQQQAEQPQQPVEQPQQPQAEG